MQFNNFGLTIESFDLGYNKGVTEIKGISINGKTRVLAPFKSGAYQVKGSLIKGVVTEGRREFEDTISIHSIIYLVVNQSKCFRLRHDFYFETENNQLILKLRT